MFISFLFDISLWLGFFILLALDIYYICVYTKIANNFKKSIDSIFDNLGAELGI